MSSNKSSIPNSLNEHWMPFTSNKDFKENPRLITEAKGVYMKNHHGQTLIDASSGLFCNPLGHGRKEIIAGYARSFPTIVFGKACCNDSIFGYTTIEAKAIRIHGHGLTA